MRGLRWKSTSGEGETLVVHQDLCHLDLNLL